jgi:hypothetical protein
MFTATLSLIIIKISWPWPTIKTELISKLDFGLCQVQSQSCLSEALPWPCLVSCISHSHLLVLIIVSNMSTISHPYVLVSLIFTYMISKSTVYFSVDGVITGMSQHQIMPTRAWIGSFRYEHSSNHVKQQSWHGYTCIQSNLEGSDQV